MPVVIISEGKPPTELVHQLIIPTSKQIQILYSCKRLTIILYIPFQPASPLGYLLLPADYSTTCIPHACTHIPVYHLYIYHSHTQLFNIIKWHKRTCKLHHTHQMYTLSYLAKHINVWVKHVHPTHTFPVNLEGFIQERESGLRLSKTRPVIRSRFRICAAVCVGGGGRERERERGGGGGREREEKEMI